MPTTETHAEPATATDTALTAPWHVVVFNDPVNLMSYVVMVFRRVFGFDRTQATRHMREVHEQGRSVLWTGDLEKAEYYAHQLQQWQLNARVVKDTA